MSVSSQTDSKTILKNTTDKPPFKLCFSNQRPIGQSDAYISKINGILNFTANFVTPKFYSRENENLKNLDLDDTIKRIKKEDEKIPKGIYRWPLLTSHTYGWWHEKGIEPKDQRFQFHKKTSDLVSFQMKIYAEDKKTKNPNPNLSSRTPIFREGYLKDNFYDKRNRLSKDRLNGE
ncbi:PREDICTED: uncharacterized protein LOC107071759 [Polistes dominula]|uniref:Uncharacterized protein LOC107071759 n=1 Tax=Polistes dominula TaxID=743375 RepID=A0ABM1J226_POLDO|nr:PREDICTED: uncharacterized protein LOC107071759 [Polistes dominula]